MDNKSIKLPVYAKLSLILIGLVALFYILFIAQDIIVPIVFAMLLAVLLNPLVSLMERIGMNRVLSILIAITLGFIVAGGVLYFIGAQLGSLSETLPLLKEKFNALGNDFINFIVNKFNIEEAQVNDWLSKMKKSSLNNAMPVLHSTISTLSAVLVLLILIPVYVFMFLFYKPLLLEFISELFKDSQQSKVAEVLSKTRTLIQRYLIGLLVECVLVATLNSVGLLIIGVDNAILFGVIGALLNIIPYIGGIVAITLPMTMALATQSVYSAVLVFIMYMIVQFIDNNIIVPRFVASKVKINALISIIVVIVGGAMWGVAGMFLSIPLTAIVKVIFDRIPPLMPFGFLLGDTMPTIGKNMFKFKAKGKK